MGELSLGLYLTIEALYIRDNFVYQTYLQMKDEEKSENEGKDYYEDMVCSITHDPLDFGKIMHNEKRVESFCGTKILGSINSGRYLELQNEATGKECRSWQAMYKRSETETPGDGDESITCAVRRKLESPYSRI